MSLQIGDKVKMTKRGFRFYSNVDTQFDMGSVGEKMNAEQFTMSVCELFAIHGVGTIKRFNDDGTTPYVRWDFSINGIKYHYHHYFDVRDIKKLSFLDKIIFTLKGLL
jgi:hypothetical protein